VDLDLMLVIGGYNSSNTRNLARLTRLRVPTYHIADASSLISSHELRHRPVDPVDVQHTAPGTVVAEKRAKNWLPGTRAVTIGLTAGASTPDAIVGEVVGRLETFALEAS
jgi:4-hydroxy-3-methylbut-2-enyl diphosphate reductase